MASVPETMRTAEVAEAFGVNRSNIRKMLERYGIHPVQEKPPRWRRETVEAFRAVWEADEKARDADRRRAEAHRRRT